MSKCTSAAESVKYFGQVVSKNHLRVEEQNIMVSKEYPILQNKKDIQFFIDLVSYYCGFTKECSKFP